LYLVHPVILSKILRFTIRIANLTKKLIDKITNKVLKCINVDEATEDEKVIVV